MERQTEHPRQRESEQNEERVANGLEAANREKIRNNRTWIVIAQHFVSAMRAMAELGQALYDAGLDEEEVITRAESELRAALADVAKRVRF